MTDTAQHTLYLLDTNIISNLMRDPEGPVAQRVLAQDAAKEVCTSLIVQCELQFGLQRLSNPKWERQFQRAMACLQVKMLDQDVVPHYARIRAHLESLGTPIGPNDTLIAAHALALGATLITADAEFSRVPGLQIENWLHPS